MEPKHIHAQHLHAGQHALPSALSRHIHDRSTSEWASKHKCEQPECKQQAAHQHTTSLPAAVV